MDIMMTTETTGTKYKERGSKCGGDCVTEGDGVGTSVVDSHTLEVEVTAGVVWIELVNDLSDGAVLGLDVFVASPVTTHAARMRMA